LTPWPPSLAGMPWAGSARGWPAVAHHCWGPRSKPRSRCPLMGWPMKRCPGGQGRRSTSRPRAVGAVAAGYVWYQPPIRPRWRQAMARLRGQSAPSRRPRSPARAVPMAGTRRARHGDGSCPRSPWGCAFATRFCRARIAAQACCGIQGSRGPGGCLRRRRNARAPNACGAWPHGRRRPSGGPSPRWWCRGVAGGAIAPRPLMVRRRTVRRTPSTGCATLKTGGSTPCATATPLPLGHGWPYVPWRCHGTFTPLACVCVVPSPRGCHPFTTSTASSILLTGCITS
jgi:hypothetical protein